MAVFGQKWLYSDKSGCIRAIWLHSGKVVVYRERWLYLSKSGCFPSKVVVLG